MLLKMPHPFSCIGYFVYSLYDIIFSLRQPLLQVQRFLVKASNQIVGTLAIKEAKDNTMFLESLSVHPQHRRQGIGTSIINYVVQLAKKERKKKIRLYVHSSNISALSLYKKTGFQSSEDGFIKNL